MHILLKSLLKIDCMFMSVPEMARTCEAASATAAVRRHGRSMTEGIVADGVMSSWECSIMTADTSDRFVPFDPIRSMSSLALTTTAAATALSVRACVLASRSGDRTLHSKQHRIRTHPSTHRTHHLLSKPLSIGRVKALAYAVTSVLRLPTVRSDRHSDHRRHRPSIRPAASFCRHGRVESQCAATTSRIRAATDSHMGIRILDTHADDRTRQSGCAVRRIDFHCGR